MSLSEKAITGTFWINLARYYKSTIAFGGGIYLARQIAPSVFGQLGFSTSIIGILWLASMFGQPYAINRYDGDNIEKYISIHVTIRIFMVVGIGILVLCLYFISFFLGNNVLFLYILCLYASQAPAQVTAIYISYMQKKLYFKRLALIDALSKTGAIILSCTLAFFGFRIWALLWLFMAERLCKFFITFFLSPQRFSPQWDKKLVYEFFQYGKFIFLQNVARRIHSKIDDLSIGTLIGSSALGYYRRAYGLCNLLHQVLTGGVMAVSTPIFGRMKSDPKRLGRNFEWIGSLLLRLSIGGYVCLALVLPSVIMLLYGEKWLPTVPLFRLMLPYALVQSFNVILKNAHLVAGKSSLVAKIKGYELFILVILLYPFIFWKQTIGAALAVDISALIGTTLFLYYLKPLANFNIKRLLINPFISALIGLIGFYFVLPFLPTQIGFVKLFYNSTLFIVIYSGMLLLLEFTFWKNTFYKIKGAFLGKE